MPNKYDIILKNATVVDPDSRTEKNADLAVVAGRIAAVEPDLDPAKAGKSIDLTGHYLVPGIIDVHTHISSWLGGRFGHEMMAKAGVATALDMSGPVDSVLKLAKESGVGLNILSLHYVRPGHTVGSADPSGEELTKLVEGSLGAGAVGLKILGGHYPLSPKATDLAIEAAVQGGAYLAFHAGTLESKSDINGFHEAIEIINDRPVHLAHINSYCRGKVKSYIQETEEAAAALEKHPAIWSESYLSPLNGTSGQCKDGVPGSKVTAMCLETGGYEPTEKGLASAIMDGWAQVNLESGNQVILATGQRALDWWMAKGTDVTISFKVNPEAPRQRLASARRADGSFVVDCISTDGGGIPRNVTVEMGLALVRLQALSMVDFAVKTGLNPARMLGLTSKGTLRPGADADVTAVSLEKLAPVMTMAAGQVIMWKGLCVGRGSQIYTTRAGETAVKEAGLVPYILDPDWRPFPGRSGF